MGTLYSIPDFVSMFMVKNMATTTVIHHVVVCVFNVFSLYNDYEQENVVRAIMIYAVFSTFAYLVNLLLASRFVDVSKWLSIALSGLALVIYVTCCGFNWSWQVYYMKRLLHLSTTRVEVGVIVAYVSLMLMLVWDDLVLMKYLYFNVKRKLKGENRRRDSPSREERKAE